MFWDWSMSIRPTSLAAPISDLRVTNDPTCAARVRQERVYGDDASPLVEVSRANAIVDREVLAYLDREFPAEHWGKFLDQGRMMWSKWPSAVTRNAGMAAFIAKRHEVRECLPVFRLGRLQSGRSRSRSLPPREAPTPTDRYFASLHARESMARGSLDVKALGLVKFGAGDDGRWHLAQGGFASVDRNT